MSLRYCFTLLKIFGESLSHLAWKIQIRKGAKMNKNYLHIKRVGIGFMVCYMDDKVWRSITGEVTREDARNIARKLIASKPEKYYSELCDCGTERSKNE
jgi:hypothetical protein